MWRGVSQDHQQPSGSKLLSVSFVNTPRVSQQPKLCSVCLRSAVLQRGVFSISRILSGAHVSPFDIERARAKLRFSSPLSPLRSISGPGTGCRNAPWWVTEVIKHSPGPTWAFWSLLRAVEGRCQTLRVSETNCIWTKGHANGSYAPKSKRHPTKASKDEARGYTTIWNRFAFQQVL